MSGRKNELVDQGARRCHCRNGEAPSNGRRKGLRIALASLALLLATVPAGTGAEELKPKFGDIGGVYYTEVSQDREACLQAIKNKVALCRQNTSFVSNTLDRKYPGCLPIFRDQSQGCADHFRSEAYKCQGSGPVRIEDFTGFACTVTETVIEEEDEPERGTENSPMESQDHGPAASPSPKCAGMSEGAECWLELADKPGCHVFVTYYDPLRTTTWSGACADGIAVGQGTFSWETSRGDGSSGEATGALVRGKWQGKWIDRTLHGAFAGMVLEGAYVNGKEHGRFTYRDSDDFHCVASRYNHGKRVSEWEEC